MMRYRLTAIATLPAGSRLDLTEAQAFARAHALRPDGQSYVAIAPVQFKAGEVIGHIGELPKAWADALVEADAAATPAAAPEFVATPRRGRKPKAGA